MTHNLEALMAKPFGSGQVQLREHESSLGNVGFFLDGRISVFEREVL